MKGIRLFLFDPRKREILILAFCLLIGFGVRYYRFDQKSLWMDEIHTYNDSRAGLTDQLHFYAENPTYLHPPLFFALTHLFHPFTHPERDLRVLPLIFGTLSIPLIFFLARAFAPPVALPCTLALTLSTYHVSLSQDGRAYSLLLFLGMVSIILLARHLRSGKRSDAVLAALAFGLTFYTSYSALPFVVFSQLLWFYPFNEEGKKPVVSSFLLFAGVLAAVCLPWVIFLSIHYHAQPLMDPFHAESPGSLAGLIYGIFHDWVPPLPLTVVSLVLLALFPFISVTKRAALLLLGLFLLPVIAFYWLGSVLKMTHFVTSRYFINLLPFFFISLFVSLRNLEARFAVRRRSLRFVPLFLILFVISNLVILQAYYGSEKQDIRGMTVYLSTHLKPGDRIFVETVGYIPGILHYLGASPAGRHHTITTFKDAEGGEAFRKTFRLQDQAYTIYNSKACCGQYTAQQGRLWIVASKGTARKLKVGSPAVWKGYFDGSFLNFARFPTDASFFLFLWDPAHPDEKGIDLPIPD
jgi:uncharacterized membrane protein